jgi:hypothetical protein
MEKELTNDLITFGKYKNQKLEIMLKDRKYCNWLLTETWFENNYEYLFNRVKDYNPSVYFLKEIDINIENTFINTYRYFNMKSLDEIELELSKKEKICYQYYLILIRQLKDKITERIKNNEENPYDIKAPTKWLQIFENKTGLNRDDFKYFINSYDLPNLTYIIEDIKKEGGIEYNGAKAYLIAKKKSKEQEEYWEELLKKKYGEQIGTQFKYNKCFFDFININTDTIYECKMNLKDYNETQYNKYLVALENYNIVYLISNDCIINISHRKLYTTNISYYTLYKCNIPLLKTQSELDLMLLEFEIVGIENIFEIL